MTISVVNVIDTIVIKESLKSMTARNMMMAAYIKNRNQELEQLNLPDRWISKPISKMF